MAVRPILIHPDPRLRKPAAPVATVDDALRALADDMLATMYQAPGIGLAAPQVGVMKRVFVMDCAGKDEPEQPMVLLNPEILWASEELQTSEEGCLSIPEVYDDVTRPERVRVRWLGLDGEIARGRVRRPLGGLRPARDRPPERPAVHRLPERGEAHDDHLADEEAEEGEGAGLSPAPAPMRLVFMGTPDFSVPALDALAAGGHDIACVLSQPPRPGGRGQRPRPSPVQVRAEALGLPVRTPATLRDPAEQAALAALGADVAVVVAYGLLLPRAILAAPVRGCLNIHASLLPRWRGAAPIQRALMAGDPETGISIMAMEAGLDTGPVLLREAIPIGPRDTAGTLHDRLAALGARLIVDALARLDTLTPAPQPEVGVTYAAKIDKAEARVDWTRPAAQVDRLIRGLSPSPGAWTELAGERTRLLLSEPAPGSGPPGTVLDDRLTIACGTGAVRLLTLQRAGREPVDAAAFLRGRIIPPGHRLA